MCNLGILFLTMHPWMHLALLCMYQFEESPLLPGLKMPDLYSDCEMQKGHYYMQEME